MRVKSFGCTNYKAFKEHVSIDVAPLTLFVGRNNSGKTALLRLIRLVLRGLSTRARNRVDLEFDGLRYGTWLQDVTHGSLPHDQVSFNVDLVDGDHRGVDLDVTVQNVTGQVTFGGRVEYPVVSSLVVRKPFRESLTWELAKGIQSSYEGIGDVKFRGLLPDIEKYLPVRKLVAQVEESVSHLGPVRAEAEAVYRLEPEMPLSITGKEAPNILVRNDELFERIAGWCKSNLDGWVPEIQPVGESFRLMFKQSKSEVNLAASGQGLTHVLPVLVQQFAHQMKGGGAFLDLIEQPELHLHPAAHPALGDVLLNSALSGHGCLLVETHSENLLLRVRRRIAEGLDPRLVLIYWVEDRLDGTSVVRRIKIDQNGEVDYWPQGVFSEGFEEVKAMRRAVRERRATGKSS